MAFLVHELNASQIRRADYSHHILKHRNEFFYRNVKAIIFVEKIQLFNKFFD